jgi:hypothetical protein
MAMLIQAGMKFMELIMPVWTWWKRIRCFAVKTGCGGASGRDDEGEPAKNSLNEGKVGGEASSTMGNPRAP